MYIFQIKLLLKRFLKVKQVESDKSVNANLANESNVKDLVLRVICDVDEDENDEFDGLVNIQKYLFLNMSHILQNN